MSTLTMSSNDLGDTLTVPTKKLSSISLNSMVQEEPTVQLKKHSLKENFTHAVKNKTFLVKREAAKRRWTEMRESLRLNNIRITLQDRLKHFGERRRRSADARRENSEKSKSTTTNGGGASPRLSPNEWQFAFDHVIGDTEGRAQFTKFLQSEYSEENILFWWAVEELKAVSASEGRPEFERTVKEMFDTFIASESPLAINIDHDTRTDIIDRVENKDPSSFPDNIYERAQAHVYRLMEKDCFSRFVHTPAYKEVAKKLSLPQTFRFSDRLSPAN